MKKLAAFFLPALLFCTSANAQNSIVMLFESEPGTRPAAIFADGFESGDTSALLDADGDKVPDLVMTNDDSEGNLLGVLVVNAASLDTLFRVVDVGAALGLAERDGMKIFGFADADADGTNEAVFANDRDVWLLDPDDHSVAWSFSSFIPSDFPVLLRAVTDITDDGFPDLVIFLPRQRQVQVWGIRP